MGLRLSMGLKILEMSGVSNTLARKKNLLKMYYNIYLTKNICFLTKNNYFFFKNAIDTCKNRIILDGVIWYQFRRNDINIYFFNKKYFRNTIYICKSRIISDEIIWYQL